MPLPTRHRPIANALQAKTSNSSCLLRSNPMLTATALYRIRVEGHVGPEWSEWFDGLTITSDAKNETILTGLVVDQAALYGILNKIHDLGIALLEVVREVSDHQ